MPKEIPATDNSAQPSSTPDFEAILAQMSQAKLNLLVKKLCAFNTELVRTKKDAKPPSLNTYLKEVYADATSPQAIVFNRFIEQNQIELFKEGNNLLFTVTYSSQIGSPVELLKISQHVPTQQEVEESGRLSSISACDPRKSYYQTNVYYDADNLYLKTQKELESLGVTTAEDGGELLYRTIELIPQYEKNLLTYATEHLPQIDGKPSPETSLSKINLVNIVNQMTHIMKDLSFQEILFSDASNKNWLLDKELQLHICDRKSFVHKDTLWAEPDLEFYTSFGFFPKEFELSNTQKKPVDVDKAHAFILGKNIYQMICPLEPLYFINNKLKKIERNNANEFNFDFDFFKDDIGQIIKKLIVSTVTESNTQRLGLTAACDIIDLISHICSDNLNISEATLNEMTENYQQRLQELQELNKHHIFTTEMNFKATTTEPSKALIELIFFTEQLDNEFNSHQLKKRARSSSFFTYRLSASPTAHQAKKIPSETKPMTEAETDEDWLFDANRSVLASNNNQDLEEQDFGFNFEDCGNNDDDVSVSTASSDTSTNDSSDDSSDEDSDDEYSTGLFSNKNP